MAWIKCKDDFGRRTHDMLKAKRQAAVALIGPRQVGSDPLLELAEEPTGVT
jgi:hypothetical protein